MGARHEDGSAGDANYNVIGTGYVHYLRPEPRIAAIIVEALGDQRPECRRRCWFL